MMHAVAVFNNGRKVRVVGNKIGNAYTLLNIKIMKVQKIIRSKKTGNDDKSAATESVTYKAGRF